MWSVVEAALDDRAIVLTPAYRSGFFQSEPNTPVSESDVAQDQLSLLGNPSRLLGDRLDHCSSLSDSAAAVGPLLRQQPSLIVGHDLHARDCWNLHQKYFHFNGFKELVARKNHFVNQQKASVLSQAAIRRME